jgi:hypothetical protein
MEQGKERRRKQENKERNAVVVMRERRVWIGNMEDGLHGSGIT